MTTPYLEEHAPFIDRIRLGLFKAIPGTLFHDRYVENPARYPGIRKLRWDYRFARAQYEYEPARDRAYRRAKTRYLQARPPHQLAPAAG